jgi:Fungal N-terminal domain of STAND proteins
MDPLSATAGVAGLISLAGAALSKCYVYGSALAAAPREASTLTRSITDLSGLLVGLQGVESLAQSQEKENQLRILVDGCRSTLEQLDTILAASAPKDSQSKLERTYKRFKWPLDKQQTLALVDMVEAQKSTLDLALGELTVYVGSSHMKSKLM